MKGTLEITTKIGCKVNCKYCPQDKLLYNYFKTDKIKNKSESMTLEVFKKCIDKVPPEIRIDFSGMCEPWLNPECSLMLEYAATKGHSIAIFTTLMGMNKNDIDIIKKFSEKIEEIVIHIPDEQQNSNIFLDDNYLFLLQEIQKVNFVGFKGLSCHGNINKKISKIINNSWHFDNNMIDRAGNLSEVPVDKKNVQPPIICDLCNLELNHNVMLPDGSVLLCCMDYGMDHIIGNLLESSYEEIINSQEINFIKRSMKSDTSQILCQNCSNAIRVEDLDIEYFRIKEENDKVWKSLTWLKEDNWQKQKAINELNEAKKYFLHNSKIQQENYNKLLEDYNELKSWNNELNEMKNYFIESKKIQEENYNELKNWISEVEKAKEYWEEEYEKSNKNLEGNQHEIEKLEQELNEMRNKNKKIEWKYKMLLKDPLIKKIAKLKKIIDEN